MATTMDHNFLFHDTEREGVQQQGKRKREEENWAQFMDTIQNPAQSSYGQTSVPLPVYGQSIQMTNMGYTNTTPYAQMNNNYTFSDQYYSSTPVMASNTRQKFENGLFDDTHNGMGQLGSSWPYMNTFTSPYDYKHTSSYTPFYANKYDTATAAESSITSSGPTTISPQGLPPMITPDDPDEIHSEEDDLTNRVKRSQSDLERFSHLPEALQPVILFRNLFHTATCTLQGYLTGCTDGYRVYIEDNVGYSGNATRFKRNPDTNEKAFVLSVNLTDPSGKSVAQCKTCKEYYAHQNYFKASPNALGRLILVKNNAPIRVDKDNFKIQFKIMCACSHHQVDYFNCYLTLRKAGNNMVVYSSSSIIYAKQWRKSKQAKEELNLTLYPAPIYNEGAVQNITSPPVENSG